MSEPTNPIALRSREMIVDSLRDLLDKKPYAAISMQMIADNAGLGRRTIYRHFTCKEDILGFYLNQLADEYLSHLALAKQKTNELTAKVFFTFFRNHLDLLQVFHRNGLMMLLLDKLDETLNIIIGTLRSDLLGNATPEYISYYRAFYSGCYWRLLTQWLDNGAKESPDEMAETFRQIVQMAQANTMLPDFPTP